MSQVKGFFILFCPPADSGPPAQARSYLLRSGRHHRSLWGPFLCLEPPAIIHHARLQPFLDQANDPLVSDPMLHELDHPIVPDFVKNDLMSKSSTQFTFFCVIPTYSASSASCWLRSGRNPYQKPRKSSSQIWLRTVPTARWAILSSSAAIPNGRCLPSAFGIQTLRDGFAR